MKVLVMDESKNRNAKIVDKISEKNHEVISCSTSNEFMNSLDEQPPEYVILDMDSWIRGRMIYSYFAFSKKLSSVPVIFINSPEGFGALAGRQRTPKDRIFHRPLDIDSIVRALE
ncbi:MAG: hypothetical protein ACOC4C_00670 [Fibrobacterota bacterium]